MILEHLGSTYEIKSYEIPNSIEQWAFVEDLESGLNLPSGEIQNNKSNQILVKSLKLSISEIINNQNFVLGFDYRYLYKSEMLENCNPKSTFYQDVAGYKMYNEKSCLGILKELLKNKENIEVSFSDRFRLVDVQSEDEKWSLSSDVINVLGINRKKLWNIKTIDKTINSKIIARDLIDIERQPKANRKYLMFSESACRELERRSKKSLLTVKYAKSVMDGNIQKDFDFIQPKESDVKVCTGCDQNQTKHTLKGTKTKTKRNSSHIELIIQNTRLIKKKQKEIKELESQNLNFCKQMFKELKELQNKENKKVKTINQTTTNTINGNLRNQSTIFCEKYHIEKKHEKYASLHKIYMQDLEKIIYAKFNDIVIIRKTKNIPEKYKELALQYSTEK